MLNAILNHRLQILNLQNSVTLTISPSSTTSTPTGISIVAVRVRHARDVA